MKKLFFIFLLLPFITNAQRWQNMPQPGYGPVKGMWIDSLLIIPTSVTGGLNFDNNRTVGKVRYNVSDSSFQVYTGYQWLSGNRSSSSGWGLSGNSGTTPGTDFLGTTDAQDLVIKTNNTKKLTVKSNNIIQINTDISNTNKSILQAGPDGSPDIEGGISFAIGLQPIFEIFAGDNNKMLLHNSDDTIRLQSDQGFYTFGSLPNLTTQNRLLGQYGTSEQVGYITLGTGLSLSAGVLNTSGTVATPISSLTAATGTNSPDNTTFTQSWNWTNHTGLFPAMLFASISTANVNNASVISMSATGAHASNNVTSNTLKIINGHTGTGSVNNGIYVDASNGGTNNAIYVNGGNVLLNPLTASQFLTLDASKNMTSTAVASSILAASLTDETGTGVAVFGTSPNFTTGITIGSVAVPTISSTNTLTNKRWTARVGSTTSSATPTINTDNVDIYKLTAQTVDVNTFSTNLSGSPSDGDILELQVTGTAARGLTWGSSFVSTTVTLPTTTVSTTTLTIILQYYTTSSYGNNKWHCVNYY